MSLKGRAPCYYIAIVVLAVCSALVLLSSPRTSPVRRIPSIRRIQDVLSTEKTEEIKHRRIFFATSFAAHFDVSLPLVRTVEQVLAANSRDDYSLDIYYPLPFRFKFQDVMMYGDTGLYTGPIKSIEFFEKDFEQAFQDGRDPTLLIMTTCEHDIPEMSDKLLKFWDLLESHRKFRILCGVHHGGMSDWVTDHMFDWSVRGALELFTISEHVGDGFKKKLELTLGTDGKPWLSNFEHILIDVFVPILNLQSLPFYPIAREKRLLDTTSNIPLRNAIIQGGLQSFRRDYAGTFRDLLLSLRHDSLIWGYQRPNNSAPFEPIESKHPFVLHIAGEGDVEDLEIPRELKNVVKVYTRFDYMKYYDLVSQMDIMIPAFPHDSYYYYLQASSTVVMAVECNTPVLATERFLAAYTYTKISPALTVTRPESISEIDAIKIMRTGMLPVSNWPTPLKPPTNSSESMQDDSGHWTLPIPPRERAPKLWNKIDVLGAKGFRKQWDDMEDAKLLIWKDNVRMVKRVLGVN